MNHTRIPRPSDSTPGNDWSLEAADSAILDLGSPRGAIQANSPRTET